jgi:hypothetical protein
MKEYIERAQLLKNLGYDETRRADVLPGSTFDIVLKEPAADVAEVVRCKDCQYYQDAKINKKGFLICPASGMEITETDYCSYGALMDKLRICEVLGVEPEESFYYKCEKSQENKYLWKITKEGERMFKEDTDIWRLSSNEKTLMDFITHPDRIIRKPRWTEEEIVIAELILSLYERKDIVFGRYENGQLWWKVGNRAKNDFPNKFFPSIRPSNEFDLIEIIGGAE